MTILKRTRLQLVPSALGAMVLSALVLAGCGKEEAPPAVDSASPSSYMSDAAFRKALKDRHAVAAEIGEAREKVTARQEEMVAVMGQKLKTGDRAKIEAALQGNAEWQSLAAKAKELDAEFMKNHRETVRLTHERLAPKGRISK